MLESVKAAIASIATSIKSALPTVVAATTATVVTGGCIYYYTIKDGIYEKRSDNVRYALEEYISQVTLDSIVAKDGGGYAYSTNLDDTVQKIMDELEEAGSNIAEYTGRKNEKEILEKLIKAEIITQYPDLRKASEIGKKVDNNELQGGIIIVRKNSLQSTSDSEANDLTYKVSKNDQILTYIPYNEFKNKIDSNDESVKQYFSLKNSDPNSTYVDIVVAGWTQETTTVKTIEYIPSNDGTKDEKKEPEPDVTKKYNFNEISINYQNSLSKYSMPAGFLWSLLVMGENVNFIDKLASLAIDNTKIVIEAQDNISTTVNSDVQKYTCKKAVKRTVVAEDGTTKTEYNTALAQNESSITTTVETKQSNTSLNLVYAETWIATYKVNYKNTVNSNTKIDDEWQKNAEWKEIEDVNLGTKTEESEDANGDKAYEDLKDKIIEEIMEERCEAALNKELNVMLLAGNNELSYLFKEDSTGNLILLARKYMYNYIKGDFTEKYIENNFTIKSDISDCIEKFWTNKSSEAKTFYSNKKIKKEDIEEKLYATLKKVCNNMIVLQSAESEVTEYKVDNKSASNIQTINTNIYTSAGTNVQERVDIDKDNNFIAYFNKSGRAKEYILSSPEWVYEMLESHEKTANIIDLFKYLLYQATGENYGVTKFDFSVYDLSGMQQVGNSGTGFWWPIGSGNSSTQDSSDDKPVPTIITSGVGPRWGKNHGGIDISGNFPIPGPYIIAADSGTVTYATKNGGIYDTGYYGSTDGGGYGNFVIIDHGNGYTTYYAHMYKGSITVSEGDRVEKGQVIGKMGSSGSSTGVHLHFEIRLNGEKLDPEEYVSQDNPRPEGISGISDELYNFILAFEGGTSHYSPTDEKYIIFNNGLDNNLELTCGVAIGTKSSGVYDYVKKILNRDVNVGDTITKEEYNQIFEKVAASKMNTVDTAIATIGVTLTQNQKDAVYSLCWNASNASQTIKDALTKFSNSGEKGYWEYIHDYTNSGIAGLVRRRAEEFEMFVDGDYTVGSVDHGITKHREYNIKYGLPQYEGE